MGFLKTLKLYFLLISPIFFFTPAILQATPINTFIAVPIAKGGYLAKMRYVYTRASNGPLHLNQNVIAPFFGYGITSKATLLTLVPLVESDFNGSTDLGIPSSTDFGVGDIPIDFRYEIFRKDSLLQTIRLDLLSGIEIPSGDAPFSSNSIDFPFAVIFTWQTTGNEIDTDFIYKINTEGNGISIGDDFFYDVSYSRRLLPWKLPEGEEPSLQMNLVLELNGHDARQSNLVGGGSLPDTGGHVLFFLSGLEWIMNQWNIQAGVQVPVVQDLNGSQLENQFNVLVNVGYGGLFF